MKESAAFLLIQRKSECTKPLQIPLSVKASGDEAHCLYKHGYTHTEGCRIFMDLKDNNDTSPICEVYIFSVITL